MQIDDLPNAVKLAKINDPCLRRVTEWEIYMDLLVFVRAPRSEPPVDTKKPHN